MASSQAPRRTRSGNRFAFKPFVAFAAMTAMVACTESPVDPDRAIPVDAPPQLAFAAGFAGTVIDGFTSGSGTWSACGNATFNLHNDAGIAGGARELVVRDAWSCTLGGKAYININAGAGTAQWYSVGRSASAQIFNYGTAIGTWDRGTRTDGRGGAWGPYRGAGTELNLSLTLDDQIRIDMAQVASSYMHIRLHDGNGGVHTRDLHMTAGTNLVPLSSFATMTAAAAADIDGVSFSGGDGTGGGLGTGNIFTGLGIEPAVTDADGDGVSDDEDPFPNSDMSATVAVGSCDSGVTNQHLGDGSWFNDHIGAAQAAASNHGRFVSAVAALADGWKKTGLISGRDQGAIVSCAGGRR